MSEYVIEFSKTGTICYTSHLDLMRIFKRAFKRTGIALAYSQGFNPHPKMGFAQPLSLGYWGMEEFFECETADEWDPAELMQRLASCMPEGIDLKRCLRADRLSKTLASHTVEAQYIIEIPVSAGEAAGVGTGAASEAAGNAAREGAGTDAESEAAEDAAREGAGTGAAEEAAKTEEPVPGTAAVDPDPQIDLTDPHAMWQSYLGLEEIQVWKRQKKKKAPKLIDIKHMIREITFTWAPADPSKGPADRQPGDIDAVGRTASSRKADEADALWGTLYVDALLDCGSDSNLSPELIIGSVCRRFGLATDRSEISVMRKRIGFDQPLGEMLK